MTQDPTLADDSSALELAAAAVIDGLAFKVGESDHATFAVTRVGTNLNDLVEINGAVVHVRQAGGLEGTWQIRARMAVDVYAATYGAMWAAASAVSAHVGRGWRPNTQAGDRRIRIDSWRNESLFAEQPYPGLSVASSIWRITTRHMPA